MEEKIEQEAQNTYPHKSLEKIENNRKVFYDDYSKHNKYKTLIFIGVIILMFGAWIGFPNIFKDNAGLSTGFMIGTTIICLLAIFLFGRYVRNKFEKKLGPYFSDYFNSVNEYVFEDKDFSEVKLQDPGKITLEEFNECRLYKDVIESGSRGLTKFKYKGDEYSVVDCAGNIRGEKSMKPVFVGKMLRGSAKYEGDIPVFIYLKGNERALPPTAAKEVTNVFEDQKMVVYTEYKDWKKVVNNKVMAALNAINTNALLVDVAVAVYNSKLFIMMGYDDPLMVLPLQNTFDTKPTEQYKTEMVDICKLAEALNK